MIHIIGGGLAGCEAAWQAAALGVRATVQEEAPALAAEAARIAAEHPERAVAPHGIIPIYVRRPDVEVARGLAGR